MRYIGRGLLLAPLLLAGCAYTAKGPEPTGAATPIAWGGEIRGLEQFNRDITVVTLVCRAHTYKMKHDEMARDRIARALQAVGQPPDGGRTTVSVETVDVRVGCHPAGIVGSRSFCRSDAIVALSVETVDARGRTTRSTGRHEASARTTEGLAGCSDGPDIIDKASQAAIDGAATGLTTGLNAAPK